MRRALVWTVAAALSGLAIGAALGHASAPIAPTGTHGFDVSWPQCHGSAAHHMPSGRPSYAILGLTDGVGHTVNPCLGSQLDWARSHGVQVGAYLVASYPTKRERSLASDGLYGACGSSKLCRLRNDGAAQAQDAWATMQTAGLRVPRVWVDVEFRHVHPWSHGNTANAAVIQGIVEGLRAAHIPLGVYSTSRMWADIVGGYRLDVPNWLPSGDGRPRHAMAMCQRTATGGVTWLAQYTRALDSDLTCPVLNPVPGHHNKLWRFRRTTQQLLSQGPAVSALQRVVGQPPTGSYDTGTAAAVSNWQASKNLAVTGQVSPTDWRAMGAYQTRGGHGFWLSRIVGPS
jgi:hypothetical protein